MKVNGVLCLFTGSRRAVVKDRPSFSGGMRNCPLWHALLFGIFKLIVASVHRR